MLEIKNITKSFGTNRVLKGVSLSLGAGEIYGLIGKNGAGTTTLMNIVSQVFSADSGSVFLDGKKIKSQNDLMGKLGYIIDIPAGFDYLTAGEYLEFLTSPMKLSKDERATLISATLALVNLDSAKDKRIKKFSRGMKQRLGIAAGLVFDPEVIIMDEPSSALDPEGRLEVLKIIESLKSRGKTILLSTHILNDVERICDRIGLMVGGQIVVEGNTQEIMNKYAESAIVVECPADVRENLKEALGSLDFVTDVTAAPMGLEIKYADGAKQKVFEAVSVMCPLITSIHVKKASIEDIFIFENAKEVK